MFQANDSGPSLSDSSVVFRQRLVAGDEQLSTPDHTPLMRSSIENRTGKIMVFKGGEKKLLVLGSPRPDDVNSPIHGFAIAI